MIEAPERIKVEPAPIIAEGVVLFDAFGPEGWRDKLIERLDELSVTSGSLCPCGILYDSYTKAQEKLGFSDGGPFGFVEHITLGYGPTRTSAWKEYLTACRDSA